MNDLDLIRSILYSKSIDSSDVKPYTGLHLNSKGDVILSTPSLDSYRVNKDPLYRYDGNMSARRSKDADYRMLSYNRFENRRYQTLCMRPPTQSYVTRIYDERFGSLVTPRTEPWRTVRISTTPGYRLLVDRIPNQDHTMISQRFNKLSPFVTEKGNIPNANPLVQESTI